MYYVKEIFLILVNLPIAIAVYPIGYIAGRIANFAHKGFHDAY